MVAIHFSVLQKELIHYLKPKLPGELMVDCTLGEGGHAELFLRTYGDLRLVGIDADQAIVEVAKERLSPYSARIKIYNSWFNSFFQHYPHELPRPDIILFDLGISIFHYEKSGRGFTFQKNEPLDMRLEPGLETSAAAIINNYPERELADLFFTYGEERFSRMIARAVVAARKTQSILYTKQLAEIISNCVPPAYRHGRIHPATRCFQALRIVVNGELERLKGALKNALTVLKVGGRMGVISFHSLEDRIVKQFFAEKNKSCTCPPEWPKCKCGGIRVVQRITKKPIRPSEEEVTLNPPSRSSRLRVIEKVAEEMHGL